jgi:hypothetical protein
MNSRLFPILALVTAGPSLLWAAPAQKRAGGDSLDLPDPVQRPVKYFGDIHPVLVEHCVSCHGPEKQKGGLRLDSRELALAGGSSYGAAIVPGKGAESPLLRFTAHLEPDMEMPPKKKILSEETLSILRAWIDQGADWPAKAGAVAAGGSVLGKQDVIFKKAATHWAFQPVLAASPETLTNGAASIDAFVEAKRKATNLSASKRADASTLLKRLHFDLTGLPPSPATMDRFVAEFAQDPDSAITKKVDELLASPHFGERWGRHWLDIARYADTQDFFPTADLRYPFAWTFRDYVIAAFNEDKPYDQFLREQIAADLMGLPAEHPSLAALGLLTVGPRFLRREDEQINDRIDVVTRGIMGLTVVCARCHDHKFDPIPTADFYALYGVFKSTEVSDPLPVITLPHLQIAPEARADYETRKGKALQDLADLTAQQRSKALDGVKAKPEAYFDALCQMEFQKKEIRQVLSDTQLLEVALDPLHRQWTAFRKSQHHAEDPVLGPLKKVLTAVAEKKAEVLRSLLDSGPPPGNEAGIQPLVLKILREKKPENEEALVRAYGAILAAAISGTDPSSAGVVDAFLQKEGLLDLQLADVERVARPSVQARNEYEKLGKAVAEIEATHLGAPVRAMALKDRAKPVKPVIYMRGDPAKRGDAVDRRFLEVLDPKKTPFPAEQSGRKELAEKIASSANPLTPRVWANQVWRYLLGRALVKTPGDFGLQAEPPTHPELLDWLASALMQRNWSTKKLVRDIVLSRTYQQSSSDRAEASQGDPDNIWLWRANQRRRDFESMRDAMLVASGQLDSATGGRAVNLSSKPFTARRTIYGYVDRVNIDPLFTTFDFPSPDIASTERSQTLVPQQALFALNDAFIIEQACVLASKAQEEVAPASLDPAEAALRALYRLVFQRAPSPEEEALGGRLIHSPLAPASETPGGAWQSGFGSADPQIPRQQAFQVLPYFDQKTKRYQGARAFPDRVHGFVSISAGGGHPGAGPGMAAIRRWVAPYAGEFAVGGEIAVAAKASGDGIRARIISSKAGLLAEWIVDRTNGSSCATPVAKITVEQGEILDFTVDCRETTTADGFRWAPSLRLLVMPEMAPKNLQTVWDAQADFKNPPPPKLTSLERMAQALLITNEFIFID